MSNKQAQPSTKVVLVNLIMVMANGSVVMADLSKIDIVDKVTKKPLFKVKESK